MRNSMVRFVVAGAAVALFSGMAAPQLWAARLSAASIIIELNDTAQDVGVQVFFDGEWKRMRVFDPDGHKIFDVRGRGSVGALGLTELFFESVEPPLDELPLDDLMARFPEGRYEFVGKTVDGRDVTGHARFTHAIPGAPFIVQPVAGDVVDPNHTVVEWQAVADPPGSAIVGYQVIVERDDPHLVIDIKLSADTTSVRIPAAFMDPGTPYIFEVLAIEEGGNQTISEGEFETE